MRPSSLLVTVGFILAMTSAVQAQSASLLDLSGSWGGSGGTATFSDRSTKDGQDLYRVSVTKDGVTATGQASWNGQRLRFSSEEVAGMLCVLGGDHGTGAAKTLGFDYERESAFDRLLGSSGNLERVRLASPNSTATDEWGGRAQLGATVAQLEGFPADRSWTRFITQNPLVTKIGSWFKPGFLRGDDEKKLQDFIARKETSWGRPVTDLLPGSIKDYDLFRAQKALALDKFGRSPRDVSEGFVDARGSVAGQAIADRRIFWQRWKPIGTPSGRLVVISPGFQETGRNFLEQIQLLNAQGDEVIVMDHQWAGYSDGSSGGLDRGYGVARDVAAVVAYAHEVAPDKKLVIFGNSMGGGPGALGAATLNDNGLIALEGAQMPKGVPLVLQAPFIRATDNLLNKTFAVVSHIPLVRSIPLPALGLPVLTTDADAMAKFGNHAPAEDVRAKSRSMTAANADIAAIMKLVKDGKGPTGRVYVLHEKDDPLADSSASVELVKTLGARARLDLIEGGNHVLEEGPHEQAKFLPGIGWATVR